MDPYYKKMMLWLAAAFFASVVGGLIIVELVRRKYGPEALGFGAQVSRAPRRYATRRHQGTSGSLVRRPTNCELPTCLPPARG
jgi:hypothetical protein